MLALSATTAASAPDPLHLLDRMNEAIRALDYEGRFVVQSGDRLDALYIVHRVDGGAEKERLVSLTGEPREIIRSDQAVACLVPGRNEPINVGRRANGRSFSPLRGIEPQALGQHYRFELLQGDRVAGREVFQVMVEPKDDLRFGYRVAIDQATFLPLRSTTLGPNGQPLTQMMFTELKVNEGITPIEHDVSALQMAKADPADWSPLARLAPAAWDFGEIPPGFRLNLHRRRALDRPSAELEHFIFSDGLATVSVYVLPVEGDGPTVESYARGAANAVGQVIADHEVIAVGEVPRQTLDWFARSIRATR
jgi:sigma-E factor negative regulatory protein RseB